MGWIIALGIALFLYGSIAMVRPSARQRRVASLRQAAAESGFELRLASRLKLPEPPSRSDLLCLLRHRSEDSETTAGTGTCFIDRDSGRLRAYGSMAGLDDELRHIFAALPSGAEVLVAAPTYVGVCWDESGGADDLAAIDAQMARLMELTDR